MFEIFGRFGRFSGNVEFLLEFRKNHPTSDGCIFKIPPTIFFILVLSYLRDTLRRMHQGEDSLTEKKKLFLIPYDILLVVWDFWQIWQIF